VDVINHRAANTPNPGFSPLSENILVRKYQHVLSLSILYMSQSKEARMQMVIFVYKNNKKIKKIKEIKAKSGAAEVFGPESTLL
jgi:hypothetical protein